MSGYSAPHTRDPLPLGTLVRVVNILDTEDRLARVYVVMEPKQRYQVLHVGTG